MTNDELRGEVHDLFRYRFAETPQEVADALGIGVEPAAAICAEFDAVSIAGGANAMGDLR